MTTNTTARKPRTGSCQLCGLVMPNLNRYDECEECVDQANSMLGGNPWDIA